MATKKKPKLIVKVTSLQEEPAAPAQRLAAALTTALSYNVRAALGQQFDVKLLNVAENALAEALDKYARWVAVRAASLATETEHEKGSRR